MAFSSLPYSDVELDGLLASNGNFAKQPHFWKKRVASHLEAAKARWPELYNFPQAEDHRNFTFNKIAGKITNLREAYLLTLFAFDILTPENLDFFDIETAIMWFLRRQLPLPQDLAEFDSKYVGHHFVFLIGKDTSIDYIVAYLRGRLIPQDLMLAALLKYNVGPWFQRYIDQAIHRIAERSNSAFCKAAMEPEIKELIMPRIHHHMTDRILKQIAEIQRIMEQASKVKNGEQVDLDPKLELPMQYLDYYIFPFVSTFAKEKRTYYQLLRALKGTLINGEAAEKPEKLPLIKIQDYDDRGQIELSLYLVEIADPATLDHVLKCLQADSGEDVEVCRNDVRARCLGNTQVNSPLFEHLLNTLPNSYIIPGPINFQAAYQAYTKKQLTQFASFRDGRGLEVMQILCPDFPDIEPDSESCSTCGSDAED
jgi:hypothetical protein